MTHVKKNKKVQIAYKENRMSPSTLDRRRVRAGAPSPHLTCNAYSQALLLGRHLVPLVDHHLPAMNINNVQLIHRYAPTRARLRVHLQPLPRSWATSSTPFISIAMSYPHVVTHRHAAFHASRVVMPC